MESSKRIAHKEDELIEIFKQKGIVEKYYPIFIERYNNWFLELIHQYRNYKDESFEENESVQSGALYLTNSYIEVFLAEIAKGHGERWSHYAADSCEDDKINVFEAYNKLSKENLELAKEELLIHCKLIDTDELFVKHYMYLFEIGEGMSNPTEEAKTYSRVYKNQISKGKSEIFAHEYAYWIADDTYHDIYCAEYAYAYDKAICENKSKDYARLFADKYASEVGDIKIRWGKDADEDAIEFAIQNVNAYMKAWEYGKEHQISDLEKFISTYQNAYFNTYYTNDGISTKKQEIIEQMSLEKALLKFNK
jgi:hypothetical protein